MAFVNSAPTPEDMRNSIFGNSSNRIEYNDHYLNFQPDKETSQILAKSTDINEIMEVFKSEHIQTSLSYELTCLNILSSRPEMFQTLIDAQFIPGDRLQYLYTFYCDRTLFENKVNIELLKPLHEIVMKRTNKKILFDYHLHFFEKDDEKRTAILNLYNEMDKPTMGLIIAYVCEKNPDLLNVVIEYGIKYDAFVLNKMILFMLVIKVGNLNQVSRIYELYKDHITDEYMNLFIRVAFANPDHNKKIVPFLYENRGKFIAEAIDINNCIKVNMLEYADDLIQVYQKKDQDELHQLVLRHDNLAIVKAFLKRQDIDVHFNNDALLKRAIVNGNLEIVKYLFENYEFDFAEKDAVKIKRLTKVSNNKELQELVIAKL